MSAFHRFIQLCKKLAKSKINFEYPPLFTLTWYKIKDDTICKHSENNLIMHLKKLTSKHEHCSQHLSQYSLRGIFRWAFAEKGYCVSTGENQSLRDKTTIVSLLDENE